MNNLKRGEKGQTIRSNNSSSSSSVGGEGVPFAEVFSTNAADKKDSLRGTQLTRSLQQNISDPDGPNEEANLRSQNMRITKTTIEYPGKQKGSNKDL